MKYRVDLKVLFKNVLLYLFVWGIFILVIKRENALVLSVMLFLLVLYDFFLKLKMMLLSIEPIDGDKLKVIIIKNFRKQTLIICNNNIKFAFEKKRFGRGLLRDFFTIYNNDKIIVSIRIAADGWSKEQLENMVTDLGRV